MLKSSPVDKYVDALKKTGYRPIRGVWLSKEGICPLYAYAYFKVRREGIRVTDVQAVVSFLTEQVGIDFRNGFTAALDDLAGKGIDIQPDYDRMRFERGYLEGELVRKHFWGY